MADAADWVPQWVDTKQANTARVYDYWLGGSHNFLADQDAGRAMAAIEPNIRAIVRANRAFIGRAVRSLTAAGVRQFLDIGSGIPTQGNVHEVAQQADPAPLRRRPVHGRRSCVSSTGSTWSSRGWYTRRCGGQTPRRTCPTIPAGSAI